MSKLLFFTLVLGVVLVSGQTFLESMKKQGYKNEFIPKTSRLNVQKFNDIPQPHEYVDASTLPQSWNWGDQDGVSLITKSLNQHIPQYCGSCWAHGALSALADRVKIARKGKGQEINLAVQYILNCGNAGSCYGGDHLSTYEFIKSQPSGLPYDTCLQYEACSSDSQEGHCGDSYDRWNCPSDNINTCRTCATFGKECKGLNHYPNVTISAYGSLSMDVDKIKSEIYKRGPVAAGVQAESLLEYQGGIFDDNSASKGINHIISIIGWGYDSAKDRQYWIVRNSWGQYWGELGFFRIEMGKNILGIESDIAWATPDTWTELNFGCYEGGENCQNGKYEDPFKSHVSI